MVRTSRHAEPGLPAQPRLDDAAFRPDLQAKKHKPSRRVYIAAACVSAVMYLTVGTATAQSPGRPPPPPLILPAAARTVAMSFWPEWQSPKQPVMPLPSVVYRPPDHIRTISYRPQTARRSEGDALVLVPGTGGYRTDLAFSVLGAKCSFRALKLVLLSAFHPSHGRREGL
jgi:hypothetical protein